jgi:uncharacterized membrane protein
MFSLYSLFKFLHIVGAIGWIGGTVTFGILNTRVAREKDQATIATLTNLMRVNGMAFIGPAAALTLLAGFAMLGVSGLGAPLWVIWGFIAIILSVAFGATLVRISANKVRELALKTEPNDSRLKAARQQLMIVNVINTLFLLSAVWAMVFKPV